MRRKHHLAAILGLGCGLLACQSAPPAQSTPPAAGVATLLAEANLAVRENQVERGIELFQEAADDPQASDGQRAEALYEIALLGLATETRIRDLPLSLRRLRDLRSQYPGYYPREVNALILLTSSLIATRSELGAARSELSDTQEELARQEEALKSVTDAVIGN